MNGITITASGAFDITMNSGSAELDGGLGRFGFSKRWLGDLGSSGSRAMLSAGDPQVGEAGYVAMEIVRGQIGDRTGGFAFQQFGTMHGGTPFQDRLHAGRMRVQRKTPRDSVR